MSKATLRPELDLMLRLSHPDCTQEMAQSLLADIPSTFDWTYFLERAIATHFAGYLLSHPELSEKYYPGFVYEKLKAYQQRILLHSTLLREALLAFIAQLDTAQIPYALLKGWDLHFRHGISLKNRQISDIDILIAEKDLIAVDNLLQDNGFQTKLHVYKSRWHEKWQPVHAPLFARKGAIMVDIHTKAIAKEHAIKWDFDLAELEKIQNQHQQITLLTRPNSELFLILHTLKHFESLHPLKASQIRDLWNIDFEFVNPPMGLKNKIRELQLFLKRIECSSLVLKQHYDLFFVHNLSGESLPFLMRCKRLIKRMKPKNGPVKSIILTFFDLFPQKQYLQRRFGDGPYMRLNLKRLQKTSR